MNSVTIVFVHGWSVTNVNTYGEMPLRLRTEALAQGEDLEVREIFLGRYISFHDEVRLSDISRAFRSAVNDQLTDIIAKGQRFICITHSTGGPVVRDWWQRYYSTAADPCPMSHLIMLAPANYGSALAQLGKSRLSRMKSWLEGVEPGQGVLDWLELGSAEAWVLNKEWIMRDVSFITAQQVFPFVITGQSIDRKLYDHLNSYTGESGSDGVMRVAAANLEARYIQLKQPMPVMNNGDSTAHDLQVSTFKAAMPSPLRVVAGKSHSGDSMGIFKSVRRKPGNDKSSETIKAIFDCIHVNSKADYDTLYNQFANETTAVQKNERVEVEDRLLLTDRVFIHDRYSMVIFRVVDTEGYAVRDFDLLLTAGDDSDPNHLPEGFFVDRQCNHVNREIITYFLNYDVLHGSAAVIHEGKEIRSALVGIDKLGLEIRPRPDNGFIRYLPCRIQATRDLFEKALAPNATTMIEICLQRIVDTEVFRFDELQGDAMPTKKQGDFKNNRPGNEIAE